MATREQEAKGVDSVTDYVEEKEDVDMSKATQGLSSLVAANNPDERFDDFHSFAKIILLIYVPLIISVSAIRISQEDISVLTDELDITKDMAERMLQTHGGNLKAALSAYVNGL
eukprot:gene9235-19154_t